MPPSVYVDESRRLRWVDPAGDTAWSIDSRQGGIRSGITYRSNGLIPDWLWSSLWKPVATNPNPFPRFHLFGKATR